MASGGDGTNFLAFDLGAESGRAVVGTLSNGRLQLAEKHRFPNPTGRIHGHLHWNLLAQWEELKTGLRKAAEGGPSFAGIGVDTWGVDFGFIGKSGEVLGNPFHYRDARTAGVMDRTFSRVNREQIFRATGIQFMQLNSLYQLVAMVEAKHWQIDAAETLLFVPDIFNYLFTGKRTSEFSIASTSQMYDMRQNAWAREMLGELGVPARILPPVVPSGTVVGPLLKDVADECGVAPSAVIAPALHDTGSAVAAVPAEGEDWCYISSGTWSLMGVEIPAPIVNDKSLKYNYTNEGGVGGKIRFLKNIMGMWLVQECRRHFRKEGYDHSYSELTQMAERSKGLGALIDPDHAPFLSPGDMPPKIDAFCRQTKQPTPATRGDYVRACLDSLALTYRRTLEGLEDILGRRINVIHIVGGGCQNELLNQMTADATGRQVVAGPVEATAMGNVLVQAMAVGAVKDRTAARQIVHNSSPVKRYEPREGKVWDKAYERFRELARIAT
jgi:sugar (pentulose or hexulose) kinase